MQLFLLALLIPYLEFIFSISTSRCTDIWSIFINLFFSYSAGLIIAFLISFVNKKKLRKLFIICALSIIPILYYAEFLVYRSFKVFYDINTCLNGAGGALTEFMGDISRLIFCFDGISRIILMYLPLLIYLLWKHIPGLNRLPVFSPKTQTQTDETTSFRIRKWMYLAFAILCYLISLIMVYTSQAHSNMYDSEYSYQSVVENMGLVTGLRLDIKNMIFGDSDDFVFDTKEEEQALLTEKSQDETVEDVVKTIDTDESGADESAKESTEESTKDVPVSYGVNAYDFDFEELASKTSGTNGDLDAYVASLTPSSKNEYTGLFEGKNLIFITAEAFSGYVVDEERTPTLYRLIHKGIYFEDFYQPSIAGTTGGEYSNIFGLMPTSGGKSIKIMTGGNTFTSMGNQLNKLGYWGRSYHNNSGSVYDRNKTHVKLGYSEGFESIGNGMEKYITGSGFPASDYEMIKGTLTEYIDKQPFNVYYMTVSGHGQYGRSINQMSYKNWDRVSELPYSDIVKCYLANNMELEDALTYLVNALEEAGIADDTVICMSPDHFPYGLDQGASLGNMPNLSELYGFKVNSYLERDKNSCILWSGCLEKMDPIVISAPTSSYDLLPTLCNLFGLEFDSRLYVGRDVLSDAEAIIFDGGYDFKTELGTYYASKNKFVPVSEEAVIPEGYVSRIRQIVHNKYNFCKGVLKDDYYGHVYSAVFGNE